MKMKVNQFVLRSIEEGYCKTQEEAFNAMSREACKSFCMRLKEQKVQVDPSERVFTGMSKKYDTLFVGFRGKYFDLNINQELLMAGLDPHFFTVVLDADQIADYKKLEDMVGRNHGPVALEYERPRKELLN